MKKMLVFLAIIIICLISVKNNKEELITIPKESIRIRIIANSNSLADQYEKNIIKNKIQIYLEDILKDSTSKQDTERIIKKNISSIEKEIETAIKELGSNTMYKINFGNNFFPQKEYKGITYESGFYDSLVITLGKGQGNNWWCVLFPPLCLIDETDLNDKEYKLFITELIEKYN